MSDPPSTQFSVAWISRGRLFVKRGDSPIEEIESDFALKSLEREMRRSHNNAWKDRSGVWGEMGMAPPGEAPWANADPRRNIRFVTMAKGDSPHEIYYVLEMGPVGGLFRYDMELEEESRLMHSQNFTAQDISRHPEDGQIAVSLRRDDGTMGLSIARHDGLFGKAVTLSDTVDEAPSWLPDGSMRLLFQSSAIGRNEHGVALGKSTCRVELLDLDREEITNLIEAEGEDLLQPRMTADDAVLFIRRPYKASHREPPSLWEVAQDVLLFPFRLVRTFVHFFNFMSMAFSGKPLITSGGPEQQKQANKPYLMLYGQAVDTRQAMAKGADKDQHKPLVPKEWELVSKSKDGRETVLAENVLAFDINAAGDIAYTDGRTIFRLTGNTLQEIGSGDIIEKVVILS